MGKAICFRVLRVVILKVPQTCCLTLAVLEAGSLKSRGFIGLCSLCSLWKRFRPRLFQLLVGPAVPWFAAAALQSLPLSSYGILLVACVHISLL